MLLINTNVLRFLVIAGPVWTPESITIFLLGGAAGEVFETEHVGVSNIAYDHVEVFDIIKKRFCTRNLPPSMPDGRFDMSAVLVNDAGSTDIYIIGGASYATEIAAAGGQIGSHSEKTVWKYSLCDHKWHVMSEMRVARTTTVAVYINGYIFVAGGWNHTYLVLSSVERFKISKN